MCSTSDPATLNFCVYVEQVLRPLSNKTTMSRWLITAALAMLLALAAHSHSAQAQSTWIPPSHRGAISSGGSGTSTNCASTGSGCTSCTYRRSSRGLLATAADPAGVASASTVSATATRITRRPIRGGSSSGSVSFGGSSGGATYNPWTGGSGSGGSGSGSSGSGSWSCNSCSSSGYYKLTQYAGVGTCGESAHVCFRWFAWWCVGTSMLEVEVAWHRHRFSCPSLLYTDDVRASCCFCVFHPYIQAVLTTMVQWAVARDHLPGSATLPGQLPSSASPAQVNFTGALLVGRNNIGPMRRVYQERRCTYYFNINK
jgi:hypothetical protein